MRNWEAGNPSRKNVADNLTTGDYPGHRPYGHRSSSGGGAKAGPTIGKGFLVTGTGNTRATGGRFAKVPPMSANKKSTSKRK